MQKVIQNPSYYHIKKKRRAAVLLDSLFQIRLIYFYPRIHAHVAPNPGSPRIIRPVIGSGLRSGGFEKLLLPITIMSMSLIR